MALPQTISKKLDDKKKKKKSISISSRVLQEFEEIIKKENKNQVFILSNAIEFVLEDFIEEYRENEMIKNLEKIGPIKPIDWDKFIKKHKGKSIEKIFVKFKERQKANKKGGKAKKKS